MVRDCTAVFRICFDKPAKNEEKEKKKEEKKEDKEVDKIEDEFGETNIYTTL